MINETIILNGRAVAEHIKQGLKEPIATLATQGITPCLATILVGDDHASATYVRMKGNACKSVGISSLPILLPEKTDTLSLLKTIDELNADPKVHGILLQHPVPYHIDERACFDRIAIEKDVDGVTTLGLGKTAFDLPAFRSATPQAILSILDYYKISIEGKRTVVIGRSPILGKPVALMLLNRNATVTICHSKTQDLPAIIKEADILVAAVGKPKYVKGNWVKEGVIILDAGYNEGNVGDVDYDECLPKAQAITPVPGGVGPVTIATLLKNTVDAACKGLQ